MRRRDFLAFAGAALAAPFTGKASAQVQNWPDKPVKLILPYAPGGGTDLIGRPWAEKLTQSLGQQFIIENRGGAGGMIGTEAAAKAAGMTAFADDSGLAVDALDGAPGIHSARWAGPGKDFRFAMNEVQTKLMEQGAKTAERRRAHFISALCVAWPDGHREEFEAQVNGTLVWPPRGTKGFGYDPMFLPDGQTQTFGEMSSEDKHGLPPRGKGLSHRARAFLKLAEACLGPRT